MKSIDYFPASCFSFFLSVVLSAYGATSKSTSAKPNFVVIVADDMGFSDPGCYGGEIQTPNLNALAQGGLRFTQFYNTARCWPSRASILTGYYAQQVRRDALPGMRGGTRQTRPAWARLLPKMLKPLGYRSYHSGKWHVDGKVLAGGFDHSYSLNDQNRFFSPKQHTLDDRPLPPVKPGTGYYATTAIADHAIEMLSEHQTRRNEQPFFLYLAFISPHFPLHALPEDIAVYKDRYLKGWDVARRERYDRMLEMGLIKGALPALDSEMIPGWNFEEDRLRDEIGPGEVGYAIPWIQLNEEQKQLQATKMAIHAAMVHRMDIEIGRVLNQLREMDAFENTVILFVSDNGASAEQIIRGDMHDRSAPPGSAMSYLCLGPGWSAAANTPFRLHKSWVHEGGISTPLIVHWPKGISARSGLRHNPGHVIDIAPTVLELAGGEWPSVVNGRTVPQNPGKSLVPVFEKDHSVTHDFFWWYHGGNRAIRIQNWKLVSDHDSSWELYDLGLDRSESVNKVSENPEKVRELEREWTKHADAFRALALQE